MSKPYTQKEIDFVKANIRQISPKDISQQLNRTHQAIQSLIYRLGLRITKKKRVCNVWTKERTEKLTNCANNHSAKEIAEIMGASLSAIRSKAQKLNLSFMGNRYSQWKKSEVTEAKRLLKEGYTIKKIAETLGKKAGSTYGQLRKNGLKVKEVKEQRAKEPKQFVYLD